jgi:hypothetical protein
MEQEEATIALRTRSKLCLQETPIEHIESSFVPPDELPVPPVDDHLWNDFLNECLNPASVSKHEDDDETDPEYNVAADPDARKYWYIVFAPAKYAVSLLLWNIVIFQNSLV